jgi:hypothetical protein
MLWEDTISEVQAASIFRVKWSEMVSYHNTTMHHSPEDFDLRNFGICFQIQ